MNQDTSSFRPERSGVEESLVRVWQRAEDNDAGRFPLRREILRLHSLRVVSLRMTGFSCAYKARLRGRERLSSMV